MPLVYVEDLSPGMILNSDLRSPSGRFILAAHSMVRESALSALHAWGVVEADIAETSLNPAYLKKQRALEPFKDQAAQALAGRLSLNNPALEPLATLCRHLVQRNARQLQKGIPGEVLPAIHLAVPETEVPPPLKLPLLLSGVAELFSIPLVFSQIVALLDDDSLSVAKLASVFDKDPGLTVRLLRMVNSPHYGLTKRVDSVPRAISLLGIDELKKLSLGRCLIKEFAELPDGVLPAEQFWRHSIRCGLFARAIAELIEVDKPQQYFTGGLLHDIGRLTMVERMPQQYTVAIVRARQQGQAMFRAEQDVLKLDYALVGQLLGERWGLEPTLVRMIGGHHSPRLANYSLPACILHIADIFSHLSGHELLLVETVPELQERAWQKLELDAAQLAPLLARVDQEFDAVIELFFSDREQRSDLSASS